MVRAPDKPLSDYRSAIPFETLRQFGFQRMMIDLIDAPEPVLCYFCQFQGLHQVPLGGDLTPAQIERVSVTVCMLVHHVLCSRVEAMRNLASFPGRMGGAMCPGNEAMSNQMTT